jgi:hypothetical protein
MGKTTNQREFPPIGESGDDFSMRMNLARFSKTGIYAEKGRFVKDSCHPGGDIRTVFSLRSFWLFRRIRLKSYTLRVR